MLAGTTWQCVPRLHPRDRASAMAAGQETWPRGHPYVPAPVLPSHMTAWMASRRCAASAEKRVAFSASPSTMAKSAMLRSMSYRYELRSVGTICMQTHSAHQLVLDLVCGKSRRQAVCAIAWANVHCYAQTHIGRQAGRWHLQQTCVVRMVLRFVPSASQREEKSQPDSAPDARSVYSCSLAAASRPSAVATSSLQITQGETVSSGCWLSQ